MTNKWIHLLSPLLSKPLDEYKAARTAQDLEDKLVEGKTYIGDCTERPIERPTHNQQKCTAARKKPIR